jgi:hypothetical protein
MSTTSENLRTIDGYLNSLWERATKLRDQHTGQAHADLNNLRHGIGAFPDGLLEAAKRIDELERENARLREFTSNADRAMRFVKLVAGQKLSKQASEWYAGEFGDEGEPDFEGAYDSVIQDARNILNDSVRAAAQEKK